MNKKLIEVALPLAAINESSKPETENPFLKGHPRSLHNWWARTPLSVCRSVLFSSLVDDPSSHPEEFPTGADQERERKRLFGILEDLVKWENTNNEQVLERAREEILKSTGGNPPPVLDPFCGGGSIPLEAQRLGLEAYASDLNPVAVLITKALIEIPPRFADKPPVNPKSDGNNGSADVNENSGLNVSADVNENAGLNVSADVNGSIGVNGNASVNGSAGVSPAFNTNNNASPTQKGWYSRGYLPHVDVPGLFQSITFRLADSLPHDVIERLAQEKLDDVERRKRIEALLDAGHGECLLQRRKVAEIVEDALLHFDGERYRLLAWCIMPNHVHALIETRAGHPLAKVVHSWKSFTAKEINKALGRSGAVWQREYFDRYIRDDRHMQAVVEYIEENPVKAKLVDRAEKWAFSSAARRGENVGEGMTRAGGTPALQSHPSTSLGMEYKWKRAQGLAEDVRYYGEWMRNEAKKQIGHLYPQVHVTPEMAEGRDDLKSYVGRDLTVIAWLWARTVKCPNPACGRRCRLCDHFGSPRRKGRRRGWSRSSITRRRPCGSRCA